MEILGFLLSLLWLVFFVKLRGRESMGMKSVACVESLPCTLVTAGFLALFAYNTELEKLVGTFFVYSEALALCGAVAFVVLALLPDPRTDAEGVGLNPLKGE